MSEKHFMETFQPPLPDVKELCRIKAKGTMVVVGYHKGRNRWLIAVQNGEQSTHEMREAEVRLVLNQDQALKVSLALGKTTP